MKTKIIYISGAEVFDIADVRAAFETVRGTLGLDAGTVLFGVPVDSDDAIANNSQSVATDVATGVAPAATINETMEKNATEPDITPITDVSPTPIIADAIAPVVVDNAAPDEIATDTVADDAPTPTPAKRRARTRTKVDAPTEPDSSSTPVVPILSVLAAKSDIDANDTSDDADVIMDTDDTDTAVNDDVVADEIVDEFDADIETVDDSIADEVETSDDTVDDESITSDLSDDIDDIDDAVATDIPNAAPERTLEQLLESMAPLRPDTMVTPDDTDGMTVIDLDDNSIGDDADATLENLAAEFAESQDKIVASNKSAGTGKIGKLKNILPFKKARRDDTGLMGDLFGWAGIAANDEDFSIPGFFTTAASKK